MLVVSDCIVKSPKVSVYVLTYNQELYVAQTIESIVCQKTTFSYELIIADDYSTDKTRDICLEYQKKYPTLIQLILQDKNRGVVDNYKSVLRCCRGEYIAGCGGDDYWCDDYKLQKHVDFMDKHDGVVVTYHDAKSIDKDDKTISSSFLTNDSKVDFSSTALKQCAWILPQTMCFRSMMKDVFIEELNVNVKNEDTFITSIMGIYGTGVYLHEIHPTAYRQSYKGIWSLQNDVHKKLMKISTFVELQKFYKKRNDSDMYMFLKDRILVYFADIQIKQIPSQEKKWYLSLLVGNIKNIGIKNFLHYIKVFLF